MIRARDALGRAVRVEDVTPRALLYRAAKFKATACQGDARRHHWELHIHHKDRDRRNNDPANLVTLCRWCHLKVHGKRSRRQAGWRHRRNAA